MKRVRVPSSAFQQTRINARKLVFMRVFSFSF
nr:MAG TPA: hypothetical protein [Caudoviricetes sp.]